MAYLGNGQSERSAAGTTTFVTNLLGLSSETTAGQTTRYVRDPSGNLLGERTPSGTFYYLFDALGSVLGLTNTAKIAETIAKYDVEPDQLTIHADRGSSQASKPVAFLLPISG